MTRRLPRLLLAVPAITLAACNADAPPTPSPSPSASDTAAPRPPPGYADGNGINDGYPPLAPQPLLPDAERTETGARNVLLSFARAIELREYDQAWAMLAPAARQDMTREGFDAIFAGLDGVTVAVPGGTMEGAAGSRYYTSKATIIASDADGRPVRIEGPIVLRRANDVDGANADQLRWRIAQLDLAVTH